MIRAIGYLLTGEDEYLQGALHAIEVTLAEAVVQSVHINLKTSRLVRASLAKGNISARCHAGMQWLAPISLRQNTDVRCVGNAAGATATRIGRTLV